jgi:hypothetical protein
MQPKNQEDGAREGGWEDDDDDDGGQLTAGSSSQPNLKTLAPALPLLPIYVISCARGGLGSVLFLGRIKKQNLWLNHKIQSAPKIKFASRFYFILFYFILSPEN